jgi:hypothetical protein
MFWVSAGPAILVPTAPKQSSTYSWGDKKMGMAIIGPATVAPFLRVSRPNGVYSYGTDSVFPTDSYQSANYWVDVVVQ